MSGMHTNVNGSWKKVKQPWVNVNGTWKKVNKGSVNIGGVWKPVFTVSTPGLISVDTKKSLSGFRLYGLQPLFRPPVGAVLTKPMVSGLTVRALFFGEGGGQAAAGHLMFMSVPGVTGSMPANIRLTLTPTNTAISPVVATAAVKDGVATFPGNALSVLKTVVNTAGGKHVRVLIEDI